MSLFARTASSSCSSARPAAASLRMAAVVLAALALGGCGTLLRGASSAGASASGSLETSSGSSSSNDQGLIAYEQVRSRSVSSSDQRDPRREPRTIETPPSYPFNDTIPFFPAGVGTDVSSDFGWRMLWGRADFHCGVDVLAPVGTPVLAVVGGEITFVRTAGHRGGVVLYVDGRQYTYWHVTPRDGLEPGDQVRAGQQIGTLADWGNNTHIHYGIYLTGEDDHPNAREITNCVDPMQLAARGLY